MAQDMYTPNGSYRASTGPKNLIHTGSNNYKNTDGTKLIEYKEPITEYLQTNEFDINDELVFISLMEGQKRIMPDTQEELEFAILHDYKVLNLDPMQTEGEWGSTAWVEKSKIRCKTSAYRMFHIWSEKSQKLGKQEINMKDFYIEQLFNNFTRIKAHLLYTTFIKTSNKIYAKGKDSLASLTENDVFNMLEVNELVRTLQREGLLTLKSNLLLMVPTGAISDIQESAHIKGAAMAMYSGLAQQYFAGGNTLTFQGLTFRENNMVPFVRKGTKVPGLDTDNINNNADVNFMFMYVKSTNPKVLPGIMVTTTTEMQKSIEKAAGTVFSGDLFNEFSSIAIELNYGVHAMDTRKLFSYVYASDDIINGTHNEATIKEVEGIGDMIITSKDRLDNVNVVFPIPTVTGGQVSTVTKVELNDGTAFTSKDENTSFSMIIENVTPGLSLKDREERTQVKAITADGAMEFSSVAPGTYKMYAIRSQLVPVTNTSGVFKTVRYETANVIVSNNVREFEVGDGDGNLPTTQLKVTLTGGALKIGVNVDSTNLATNFDFPISVVCIEDVSGLEVYSKTFANMTELKAFKEIPSLTASTKYNVLFNDNDGSQVYKGTATTTA